MKGARSNPAPFSLMGQSMRSIIFAFLFVLFGTYLSLRLSLAERWPGDNETYVIFPQSAPWIYYLFRPLAYVDGYLTGMRFHLGPHE